MPRVSRSSRLILAGCTLYVLDSFLPWNRACRVKCASFSLWHGIGIAAVCLAGALLLFEAFLVLFRRGPAPEPDSEAAITPDRITAVASWLILFFTVLKIAVDRHYLFIGAWLGLFLAAAIAYGGLLRVREGASFRAPPQSPP